MESKSERIWHRLLSGWRGCSPCVSNTLLSANGKVKAFGETELLYQQSRSQVNLCLHLKVLIWVGSVLR